MSEFIVLYRWRVPADQEDAFRARWERATVMLRDEHGGLGSCLTRNEEGEFVAIALWPSEEARASAFDKLPDAKPLPGVVRFDEVRLTVENDLWRNSPFGSRKDSEIAVDNGP